MDLTEAEDSKKSWKNTQNYTKKVLMTQKTTMIWSLIKSQTSWHAKSKLALGNITRNKASGSDGIPVELFQILKCGAVEVLHLICQQMWKT